MAFGTAARTIFFDVAYQSYLPSLVEREQLVNGDSIQERVLAPLSQGGRGRLIKLLRRLTDAD